MYFFNTLKSTIFQGNKETHFAFTQILGCESIEGKWEKWGET